VFIEKSLWRGVGLCIVASCSQKTAQSVQYASIIIDDKYRKVGQRHCSPPPFSQLRIWPPQAANNEHSGKEAAYGD
jgi:hypothetical protein